MLGELRINPFWALKLVQTVTAQVNYFIINYYNEIIYNPRETKRKFKGSSKIDPRIIENFELPHKCES